MEKNLKIEVTGLSNSARAIDGKKYNIKKLLSMQGIDIDSIAADIKFEIEHPDYCSRPLSEVLAEKIENIIYVAKGWNKEGYELN